MIKKERYCEKSLRDQWVIKNVLKIFIWRLYDNVNYLKKGCHPFVSYIGNVLVTFRLVPVSTGFRYSWSGSCCLDTSTLLCCTVDPSDERI